MNELPPNQDPLWALKETLRLKYEQRKEQSREGQRKRREKMTEEQKKQNYEQIKAWRKQNPERIKAYREKWDGKPSKHWEEYKQKYREKRRLAENERAGDPAADSVAAVRARDDIFRGGVDIQQNQKTKEAAKT